MAIILSAPNVAALPESVRRRQSLHMTWRGANGQQFDLNDPQGGLALYRKGLEGLHFPPIAKHYSSSGVVPGHRVRGWRVAARPVFWPMWVWGDSSDGWLARQGAFFDTIHPSIPGVWSVRAGNQVRTLELTGVFDTPHAHEKDPLYRGWALYDVALEAANPLWAGEKVRRGPWRAPDPRPFIPGTKGPSFFISSSSAFGSASAVNAGSVDSWGVWWIDGPLSDVQVGVGDAVIRVPFEIGSGETLRIDTDPRNPAALLGQTPPTLPDSTSFDRSRFNGSDVTRALGMQDYAPVPPGASVSLHVLGTGAGSIEFELVPLFFRAF